MEPQTVDAPMPDGRLEIDMTNGAYLGETARWAKFLSIVGFVLCGIIILFGLFASTFFSTIMADNPAMQMRGMGTMLTILYIVLGVIYFFPCLYLFRFADRMKLALRVRDQTMLNDSFRSMKSCFRFMGIVIIVFLAFYAVAIVAGIVAAAFL